MVLDEEHPVGEVDAVPLGALLLQPLPGLLSGAGSPLVDRLLGTLVHLRLGLPHAALAQLYGVDRSTLIDIGPWRTVSPLPR